MTTSKICADNDQLQDVLFIFPVTYFVSSFIVLFHHQHFLQSTDKVGSICTYHQNKQFWNTVFSLLFPFCSFCTVNKLKILLAYLGMLTNKNKAKQTKRKKKTIQKSKTDSVSVILVKNKNKF